MKNYGKTKSTIKPNPTVIDEYSVWVHSNIKELSTENGIEYEYDMIQFDKDEYLLTSAEKNESFTLEYLADIEERLCLSELGL